MGLFTRARWLPRHTIIIPHRDCDATLPLTLWSIRRSAAYCRVENYEVLVVDAGSRNAPELVDPRERLVEYPEPMPVFGKPALQIAGIEAADHPEVVSFLDADMIVGRRWLLGVDALVRDASITRLCYRVRHLSADRYADLLDHRNPARYLRWLFRRYGHFQLHFEAWGDPFHNALPTTAWQAQRAWGNSQFAVRRDVLADLRPNATMLGPGIEDLDFNRRFQKRFGDAYRGHLDPRPDYSMFHVPHDPRPW